MHAAPSLVALAALATGAVAQADTFPVDRTQKYGYIPSAALGIIFVVLFSLTLIVHIVQQGIARRYWWMTCTIICIALEVLGWAARLVAHWSPLSYNAYVIQICTLIIAPTFMSASLYWAGGLLIQHLGPDRSWLGQRAFKITFVCADIASLIVQAIGGGVASGGASDDNPDYDKIDLGSHIMLAGIVIQLAIMVFYAIYIAWWAVLEKEQFQRAGRKLQMFLFGGIGICAFAIILRGCYRVPELSHGFKGSIAETQMFMLLDAIPIFVGSVALNIWHPHWFFIVPPQVDVAAASTPVFMEKGRV